MTTVKATICEEPKAEAAAPCEAVVVAVDLEVVLGTVDFVEVTMLPLLVVKGEEREEVVETTPPLTELLTPPVAPVI